MDSQHTFALAAAGFLDLVERLPTDRWDQPGLGAWDLRALVGHASRSLITVDTYLDRPAAQVDLATPESYFVAALAPGTGADPAIVERGRQAGTALGEDPAATVLTLAERVLARVVNAGDPVIETIAGGMRLSAYLPTRTFELVVHSFDIAAAVDLEPPAFGEEVLAEVAAIAARIAVSRGRGEELITALTGRRALAVDFTVV
jgi:hypothetical protein